MEEPSRSATAPPVMDTPAPAGETALVALLAVSPPAREAQETASALGGQLLPGITSQGGMEVAVFAFGSTGPALHCARKLLESSGGDGYAIGMHLGEVAVDAAAALASSKPNSDRESIRIATGLSQQADEGSAFLSQVFCETARAETDVPAGYMGPKQIRLVTRTVPVFKLNTGDERASRKVVISTQMDMLLMEERQRIQEQRERRRKQSRIAALSLLIVIMLGAVLLLTKVSGGGKLGQVLGMLRGDPEAFGDAPVSGPAPSVPPPSATSGTEITEAAVRPFLRGAEMNSDQARASFCQVLAYLAQSAARWESPGEVIGKSLQGSAYSAQEQRIITDRLLAEYKLALEAQALSGAGLDRLSSGLPPEGTTVLRLLPVDRYPEYAGHPGNFALRPASQATTGGPPPLEAMELLEKLRSSQ